MRPASKNKNDYGFTYVLLGLVLGFFLGSGIVYWYSNRQNDSIFAHNLWDYFSRKFQGNESSGTYAVTKLEEPAQEKELARPVQPSLAPDTLLLAEAKDSLPADTALLADLLSIQELDTDSLGMNDLPPDSGLQQVAQEPLLSGSADIRIAQDRLLLVRAYLLPEQPRETQQSQSLRQLDSLLGNFNRRAGAESMMLVEFWASPLNFRGYKMSRNKLIVYGLDQTEAFSLHSDGKSYLIKYFDNYYPVIPTHEFRPLQPLNDPELPD